MQNIRKIPYCGTVMDVHGQSRALPLRKNVKNCTFTERHAGSVRGTVMDHRESLKNERTQAGQSPAPTRNRWEMYIPYVGFFWYNEIH